VRVVKVTGPVAERAAALRRQQGPTAGPGDNVSTGWMQWVDVLLVYLPDSTRLVKFSCRFDIKILIASYKPQSPVTKLRHQASVSIRVQSQSELFSRRQQQSGGNVVPGSKKQGRHQLSTAARISASFAARGERAKMVHSHQHATKLRVGTWKRSKGFERVEQTTLVKETVTTPRALIKASPGLRGERGAIQSQVQREQLACTAGQREIESNDR